MQAAVERRSVDLSAYPDLVMIMLGFRLRGWRGLLAVRRIGIGLRQIDAAPPAGLLAQESLWFGLTHVGFRQYWRDLDTLERFTRSEPHAGWWRQVSELSQGAGFWHETYHAKGGVEALYVGLPAPVGLQRFAPERQPIGPFMTARSRVQGGVAAGADAPLASPV